MKYPELDEYVDLLSDDICILINRISLKVESKMPYKAQYLLEEIIKQLQERV